MILSVLNRPEINEATLIHVYLCILNAERGFMKRSERTILKVRKDSVIFPRARKQKKKKKRINKKIKKKKKKYNEKKVQTN